jgi:hypothetical protein
MPFVVEDNKPVNPTDLGFFSTVAEMVSANYFPDMIQELRTFHFTEKSFSGKRNQNRLTFINVMSFYISTYIRALYFNIENKADLFAIC